MAAKTFGYPTAGLYGYSHMTGGYSGGQAEYVRVPMADTSAIAAPDGMDDEHLLFLTDILPTGWQGAEQCQIQGGEIIAIWGAGPVGLFAVQSAKIMGAERIIVIETVPERIALARRMGATDIIDFASEDVFERIKEISKGEGADGVIDCVGMEATAGHGAASQASHSAGSASTTGIAFGCSAATSAFGSVVRKPNRSQLISPSLILRTQVQSVQTPAKKAMGRSSLRANQTG